MMQLFEDAVQFVVEQAFLAIELPSLAAVKSLVANIAISGNFVLNTKKMD